MAKVRWVGKAPAVAQNSYAIPSGVTANSTWSLTIGNKTVRYASAAGTVADVVGGLLAAATDSVNAPAEFADVTWTNQTTYLQATAKTLGQPFTLTGAASVGGTLTVQNGVVGPNVSSGSTASTGGTITGGTTQFYRLTAYNACGESLPGNEFSQVVPAGTNTNTVTLNWPAVVGAVGYKVYGRATGAELLLADVGDVLTWLDNGSLTPSGALPTTNTSVSSGPCDISIPSNWSGGALPVNADDVSLDHSAVSLLYNLSALSAVTLNSLTIHSTFTGQVGLAEINSGQGGSAYVEYRPRYLQVGATTVNVGQGTGQGSQLINLDAGAVQTTLNVVSTGSSSDPSLEALQWKGSNAANVVQVLGGTAALAGYGSDSATVSTLSVDGSASVRCGPGLTLTTLKMESGTVVVNSAVTTVTKEGGDLTLQGSGAVGTLTDDSGTTHYNSTGTLTTANVGPAAVLDFSGDMQAKAVTSVNISAGGSFLDPFGVVTLGTNGIQPAGRCRLGDVTLNLGESGWKVT